MTSTKGSNPFNFDFSQFTDVEKMMSKFTMPGLANGALAEAQRKNIEALTTANKVAFEGAQALAQRQTEILRQGMEELSKAMQEMASGGSPAQALGKQAELVKESYEVGLANLRELTEMSAKSQAEAIDVLNKRFTESLDEWRQVVATSAKGK